MILKILAIGIIMVIFYQFRNSGDALDLTIRSGVPRNPLGNALSHIRLKRRYCVPRLSAHIFLTDPRYLLNIA